ncbi:MAG TPA: UDP-N-acetylmuramoyl-tripeptide--D-alanyl-D-alanine ligase [Solirubrobacteraceae bacterium]|jgi:UDP-N-acetylmuramoyl-tripeptide--D-alanyl-D-alanine ligase
MRAWDAARVAAAAGATLLTGPDGAGAVGPSLAVIDSRQVVGGELFVGLRGERVDGGEHALEALAAGAWGVLVDREHAERAAAAQQNGAVLAHEQPLAGLQSLARAWRRELGSAGAGVVGITGSTGKTSTKDILAAILAAHRRVVASPENLNTEIGLPLAVLAAPAGTQALVVEMAMRGAGQIAELAAIAEPDVGVIVNVGPVHLELLGSLEAIAAAKAELIVEMRAGAKVIVPAGEPLLQRHLRADVDTITFGEGGDVELEQAAHGRARLRAFGQAIELETSFSQAHNLQNLLAAVAAAVALGVDPAELGDQGALEVRFSSLRGERLALTGGVVVVNDCYNANPMSMRAALDDLAQTAPARRVAVLGDMLELGPQAARLHREIGLYAADAGVDLLITVGPLAAEMRTEFEGESYAVADAAAAAEQLRLLLGEGDTVLVKGSRGVGLERVAQSLGADTPAGASAGDPGRR